MADDKPTDTALVFYVNDERIEISEPDPSTLLVDWLRSAEVGLTGTKKVCAQGAAVRARSWCRSGMMSPGR